MRLNTEYVVFLLCSSQCFPHMQFTWIGHPDPWTKINLDINKTTTMIHKEWNDFDYVNSH